VRRIFAVLGGLLAVSMWTFAAAPPADKKFEVKGMGAVTFSHANHEKGGIKDCTLCHHKAAGDIKDAAGKPCGECHTKETKTTLKAATHEKSPCKACHEKEAKAPKKCADCHKKA
jgi:hypothetical protein